MNKIFIVKCDILSHFILKNLFTKNKKIPLNGENKKFEILQKILKTSISKKQKGI